MARPRKLLVTVGSTLFTSLTNLLLSPQILSILPGLGIEEFVIQYGSADLLALTDIEDLEVDSSGHGVFTWKDYNGLGEVRVEVMRYTHDFEGLVRSADAVISHAGSGSILTVLRSDPPIPLLVVPNTSLMDNHQAELADALETDGYLITSTIGDLPRALERLLEPSRKVKPFPAAQPARFQAILDEAMGFAP